MDIIVATARLGTEEDRSGLSFCGDVHRHDAGRTPHDCGAPVCIGRHPHPGMYTVRHQGPDRTPHLASPLSRDSIEGPRCSASRCGAWQCVVSRCGARRRSATGGGTRRSREGDAGEGQDDSQPHWWSHLGPLTSECPPVETGRCSSRSYAGGSSGTRGLGPWTGSHGHVHYGGTTSGSTASAGTRSATPSSRRRSDAAVPAWVGIDPRHTWVIGVHIRSRRWVAGE